jgi:hypothetical protein
MASARVDQQEFESLLNTQVSYACRQTMCTSILERFGTYWVVPSSDLVKLRDLIIARGLDNTAGQVGGDSGSVARGCRGTTPTTTLNPTRAATRIATSFPCMAGKHLSSVQLRLSNGTTPRVSTTTTAYETPTGRSACRVQNAPPRVARVEARAAR